MNPSAVSRTHEHASVEAFSTRLAERIGRHKYEMWFGRSAQLHIQDLCVQVAAESPFVADWIRSNFLRDLTDTARETLGDAASVLVQSVPDLFADHHPVGANGAAASHSNGHATGVVNGHVSQSSTSVRARRHDERHDEAGNATSAAVQAGESTNGSAHGHARRNSPSPSRSSLRQLDDFVVGPCNQLAFLAAKRLVERHDAAVSPLFIHGECGVGKTHLLQGICRQYAELSGRATAMRYVTGEQFTNEYITAVRTNAIDAFRKRIRRLELLAIDDVHFLANKVATQSEFLHTLDTIGLSGAKIVLASDEHPRHIKRFSQALISRFLSGMVVRIDAPALETRAKLIDRLASCRALRLNAAATQALACRFVGSVRELEGAVTKLAAMHELMASDGLPGEAGMVLVNQLMQDATWQPRTPVRIVCVIQVVCDKLGVQARDLAGKSRHRRVVLARALVAHLGRQLTTMSYPEIARALGRNFHSTIHNADHRLQGQIKAGVSYDPGPEARPMPLAELVDRLKHDILRGAAPATV